MDCQSQDFFFFTAKKWLVLDIVSKSYLQTMITVNVTLIVDYTPKYATSEFYNKSPLECQHSVFRKFLFLKEPNFGNIWFISKDRGFNMAVPSSTYLSQQNGRNCNKL